MEGVAPCSICEKPGVLYTCSLCGRRVCGNCVSVRGVCRDCLTGRKMGELDDDSPPENMLS
ncbi:MAG: orotate phosphoribosyltransferase [Candidatus Altiarchaeota archaeon]